MKTITTETKDMDDKAEQKMCTAKWNVTLSLHIEIIFK